MRCARLGVGTVLFPALLLSACPAQKPPHHAPLPEYSAYDPKADGHKQIDDAIERAKAQNKRVLVMFGGNWCKWCRALDQLFVTDARVKAALDRGYVLVHVDSDRNQSLNVRYGNPFQHGFPVLVVVNTDGEHLQVQETGSLELEAPSAPEGQKPVGHDPAKVLAFLQKWMPPGA